MLRMVREGHVSMEKFEEMDKDTPENLPERLNIKPRFVKEVKIQKPIKPASN